MHNNNFNISTQDIIAVISQTAEDFIVHHDCTNEEAAYYFLQAAEQAEQQNLAHNIIVQLWQNCGRHFYIAYKFIESLKAFHNALIHARSSNDIREECLIRLKTASVLQDVGDLDNSLEEIHVAYKSAELLDDEELKITVKLVLGNYYYYRYREDAEIALQINFEILNYYEQKKDTYSIARTCLNIGAMYEAKHDVTNSIMYQRRALSLFNEVGERQDTLKSKFFLGAMLEESGYNPEEGIALLEEALNECVLYSVSYEEINIRVQLSDSYQRRGNEEFSYQQLQKAHELLNEESPLKHKIEIYWRLAQIEERKGNLQEAHYYLKEHTNFLLSNERETQQRNALELEVKIYRMEEKSRNESLEKELNARQRINDTVAFHTLESEQFLKKLLSRLSTIESKIDKKSKKQILALQTEIEGIMNSKKEWSNFEQGYIEAHSEFEQKLTAQYPSLTPTERKVCILLRAGRSTKEIAQLLHISPDTADTHRTRIRKKLGLKQGTSTLPALTDL